jgi:dienelactone hydrolase
MGITLWEYYANRAAKAAENALAEIRTASDWNAGRADLHRQFMDSLGLDPLPPRCPLALSDYGSFSGSGYRVRKIAFQILPDCWATGAVFQPDPPPPGKCPGVLYLCGHGPYGTIDYQAHAIRWARRGYVCLILDTLEQHDNPGEHHGLYTGLRPDWISLGYTAAGGELWNSIRALDVLAALPEVDAERLGVTGLSGGGAQSFFLAAADSRVRAVATSCGVSVPLDALHNRHLLGHCDCVYYHNRHGKDPSAYAALIAPRAALFSYAAGDVLFSPGEAESFVARTRRIFKLLGVEDRCAFQLGEGPHGESAAVLATIDRWFDRYVAGGEGPAVVQPLAERSEAELTVFNGAPPVPNRLDLLPELLPVRGSPELPRSPEDWPAIQRAALEGLRNEVFGRLAGLGETLELERRSDAVSASGPACRSYAGLIGGMDVWLETVRPRGGGRLLALGLAGPDEGAGEVLGRVCGLAGAEAVKGAFEPRGSGFTAVPGARAPELLRAGLLNGLTPVMLMMQDLRLLVDRISELEEARGLPLVLYGRGEAAAACLYHALLDGRVAGVVLEEPPVSHRRGAPVPGILRRLDMDQALGLMAPRPVALVSSAHGWGTWARRAYGRLGRADRFMVAPCLGKAFDQMMEKV